MSIAQRATSKASITGGGYHTLDRWFLYLQGNGGTWTMSQDTDVPTGQGFAKSLKLDCTATASLATSGSRIQLYQAIEGQNLQYLKKGTSNASSLTVSFWVKSTKTGTFNYELYDNDNARHSVNQFTINSSNTWEKKSLTYSGDTSGAFNNDNNLSLYLLLFLGAENSLTSGTTPSGWSSITTANRGVGQVNIGDNTANNFWITGVQLEAGTTASDFEFLPHDVNLQRCQRYYYKITDVPGGDANGYFATGYLYNSNRLYFWIPLGIQMRTSPTLESAAGTDYYIFYRDGTNDNFNTILATEMTNRGCMLRSDDTHISGTAGQAGGIHSSSNSKVAFSSEL
jgi:hypothetical protein